MRTLILALCAVVLAGCATHKGASNSFVDPAFASKKIGTVAVFPIRNTRLAPAEARQLNRRLALEIRQQNPGLVLVNEAQSIERIDSAGLGESWSDFVTGFSASGIPDTSKIQGVGEAIGADAILQGELVSLAQQDGVYGGNLGTTRVTVRYTLFDADTGQLLWEISAEGRRQTATTMQDAPPIMEAIELAVEKMLDSLPPIKS